MLRDDESVFPQDILQGRQRYGPGGAPVRAPSGFVGFLRRTEIGQNQPAAGRKNPKKFPQNGAFVGEQRKHTLAKNAGKTRIRQRHGREIRP